MPKASKSGILPWLYIFMATLLLTANQGALGAEKSEKIGFTLSTDKEVYLAGEPIKITFEAFNNSGKEITLYFNASQRYDFIIKDPEGKEAWQWSSDKVFAQVLGTEALLRGKPIRYSEVFTGTLKPGIYKITGVLTDRDNTFWGGIKIQVLERK